MGIGIHKILSAIGLHCIPSDNRTKLAAKNIGVGIVARCAAILISFFCVPVTLDYLNEYEYGIWLTLNSILSWIFIMDVGINSGLRTKLTEAISGKDFHTAKGYITTAFISLTAIITTVCIIFCSVSPFINWYGLLNVNAASVPDLGLIMNWCVILVGIGFIFRLVGVVYLSLQLPAVNESLNCISSLISFVLIYLLSKSATAGSLLYVAVIFTASPAAVYLIACIVTFIQKRHLMPEPRYARREYLSPVVSLGFKFFILQITGIVLFMTSNLIISRWFGPEEVTPYGIAFKYTSLLTTSFTILLVPFCSAVTDALAKGDYMWIKKTVKRLNIIWLWSLFAGIILTVVSPFAYKIWIGSDTGISFYLTCACALYSCIYNLTNIYSHILAGTGKLTLQVSVAVIQAILFIPLALVMSRSIGVVGVPVALTVILLIGNFIPVVQIRKIVNRTASGIWIR
ncbi:MAG: MATE family efflux transporter [Paramuribaculum sp.]|nr:MATE family efflux transporter [Paramuribaculum sp.]